MDGERVGQYLEEMDGVRERERRGADVYMLVLVHEHGVRRSLFSLAIGTTLRISGANGPWITVDCEDISIEVSTNGKANADSRDEMLLRDYKACQRCDSNQMDEASIHLWPRVGCRT